MHFCSCGYVNIYCKGNVAYADKNKKGLVTGPSKRNAFQDMYMHKKETTCLSSQIGGCVDMYIK